MIVDTDVDVDDQCSCPWVWEHGAIRQQFLDLPEWTEAEREREMNTCVRGLGMVNVVAAAAAAAAAVF